MYHPVRISKVTDVSRSCAKPVVLALAYFGAPSEYPYLSKMLDLFALAQLRDASPDQLRAAFTQLCPPGSTRDDRIAMVQSALEGPFGSTLRTEMARWIVDHIVPVRSLVPRHYQHLAPIVRDAMEFEVAHLSADRLAPKLIEQIELPPNTRPEARLFRLISKVPGLQKLGQVLARNRHLRPSLRNALSKLENGIRDVSATDIRVVIEQELGPKIEQYGVEISTSILSEASVSAVLRFTWRDPESGERRRGVFKVLKPHIPACFAEDMDLLHRMAQHLGAKHTQYGFAPRVIQDTFRKVRQLLEHEIDFSGEQRTLAHAAEAYRNVRDIRVPTVIAHLCTSQVTAMTELSGTKVTNAARKLSVPHRRKLAERLTEALVAVPLCSPEPAAMFHGDPHAGNLLYDPQTGDLGLVDWALTESLSLEQRRHLALFVAMVTLRNATAVCLEIDALTEQPLRAAQKTMVRRFVAGYLEALPLATRPQLTDAMMLLERIALKGVHFPGSLIMFSKVMFTLDGILRDIHGDTSLGPRVARKFVERWLRRRVPVGSPLAPTDWLNIAVNGLIYGGKLVVQWERELLDRRFVAGLPTPVLDSQ